MRDSTERPQRHRLWLAPGAERAIGAAAAAVFAAGVASTGLLGDGDGGVDRPTNLVEPVVDLRSVGADGESAAGLSSALRPVPVPSIPVGARGGPSSYDSGTGSAVGARSSSAPVPRPAPTPQPAPASPSAPSSSAAPATPAPAPVPAPSPAPDQGTQVGAGVPGVAEVGVGDCTGVDIGGTVIGCDPQMGAPIEVQLPGLSPLP